MNFKLFKKSKKKAPVGSIKPDPPPWDVPLDQTKPPMVERDLRTL
jgi:hypothetical protein